MKALRILLCSMLLAVSSPAKLRAPTVAMAEAARSEQQWTDAQAFARQYRPVLQADSVRLTDSLAYQIVRAADRYAVERQIAFRLVWAESRFKHNALGKAGDVGLMQVIPSTGRRVCGLTVAQLRPVEANLDCGFKYLARMLKRYHGNEWFALVGYNRGPYRADLVKAQGLGYPERILLPRT